MGSDAETKRQGCLNNSTLQDRQAYFHKQYSLAPNLSYILTISKQCIALPWKYLMLLVICREYVVDKQV